MIKFKKSTSVSGKFDDICVQNGMFIDNETGEIIELAKIIQSAHGNGAVITITTKEKTDQDIEPEIQEEDGDLTD